MLDDYYSSREEVIDFYTKLSKKIAKMRLRGMSSWKPKHFKIMYAIQSGKLLPPDMVLHSIMDPNAYPGTEVYSHGYNRKFAMKRGLFNPHVLFPISENKYKYKEDPFTMGTLNDPALGGLLGVNLDTPDEAHFFTTRS